jgi:hypothetical protein
MQYPDPFKQNEHKPFRSTVQARIRWQLAMRARVRQQAKMKFRKYSQAVELPEWTTFISSSPEAALEGNIILTEGSQTTQVAFNTRFLFTCVRSRKKMGKITWSVSLS